MKKTIWLIPLVLSVGLAACDNDSSKFPGFESVEVPGRDVEYMIDPSSVKIRNAASTDFLLLKKLEDGYVIQQATTDCKNEIFTEDGFFYSYKDSERKDFPGSGQFFKIGGDPHYRMLVKKVCKTAETGQSTSGLLKGTEGVAEDSVEDNIPEDGVEESASDNTSEIIQRPKQSGFLMRESEARKDSYGESSDRLTLPNGSEITVTGASPDDVWFEVIHKGNADKLYVRSADVGLFGP